jgi:hypothetical protein
MCRKGVMEQPLDALNLPATEAHTARKSKFFDSDLVLYNFPAIRDIGWLG